MKTKTEVLRELNDALIEFNVLLSRSAMNDGEVTKEMLNEAEARVRRSEHDLAQLKKEPSNA